MSRRPRTGLKGIVLRCYPSGRPRAFGVDVSWKGQRRSGVVRFIGGKGRPAKDPQLALVLAIEMRERFEVDLRKPRSPHRIIASKQGGINIDRRRKRVQVSWAKGKRRTIGYAHRGLGAAIAMAAEHRAQAFDLGADEPIPILEVSHERAA